MEEDFPPRVGNFSAELYRCLMRMSLRAVLMSLDATRTASSRYANYAHVTIVIPVKIDWTVNFRDSKMYFLYNVKLSLLFLHSLIIKKANESSFCLILFTIF